MPNEPHNAILLYNQRDIEAARPVHAFLEGKGLKVWFASEHLFLGDTISHGIGEALAAAQHALICFGGHDRGNYQSREISAALTRAHAGKLNVIPVFLPGGDPDRLDDPFLADRVHLDLRKGYDVAKLAVLADRLRPLARGTGSQAAASWLPEQSSPSPDDPPSEEKLFQRLARRILETGLTVFLGCTVPERERFAVPSQCSLAADLLKELNLLPEAGHLDPKFLPLLPAPNAALVYGLGGQPDRREEIIERLKYRSIGVAPSYRSVADLCRKLLAEQGLWRGRRAQEPRLVVVTTNLDLSPERAFLSAGVPFSRLVYNHRSGQFECLEFAPVEEAEGQISVGTGDNQVVARSFVSEEATARTRTLAPLRERLQALNPRSRPDDIDDVDLWDTAQLNGAITQYRRIAAAKPIDPYGTDDTVRLLSLRRPILLKVHGSCDSPDTCMLYADDFYAPHLTALPGPLRLALGGYAGLFVGYGFTEVHFLHLFELLLRKAFESDPQAPRLALLSTPDNPSDAQDLIRRALWNELPRQITERFRVTGLQLPVTQALDRLLLHVNAELRHSFVSL